MATMMHGNKDKRKFADPDETTLRTRASPSLASHKILDGPEGNSQGTRKPPLCAPDEVVPIKRKRSWRYNRVWTKDQKWTREGLDTSVQQRVPPPSNKDQPTTRKGDESGKDLSETGNSPSRETDEVVPKRRRITWRYNRVWRRDQKWTREEQTQQPRVPPTTQVTNDGPTKVPPVPEPKQEQTQQPRVPPTTQMTSDGPTKVPPVPEPKQPEPPKFLRTYWRTNRVWRRDMVWTRKVNRVQLFSVILVTIYQASYTVQMWQYYTHNSLQHQTIRHVLLIDHHFCTWSNF
ncbi:uncharacterized protein LOC134250283 [Saccostrea cucullata]|uniref:uncharacterized protein LOC134250283 n=1 Tax=Saccostrea cuccullata TaxID=36930 RepID=UPI002ED2FAD1